MDVRSDRETLRESGANHNQALKGPSLRGCKMEVALRDYPRSLGTRLAPVIGLLVTIAVVAIGVAVPMAAEAQEGFNIRGERCWSKMQNAGDFSALEKARRNCESGCRSGLMMQGPAAQQTCIDLVNEEAAKLKGKLPSVPKPAETTAPAPATTPKEESAATEAPTTPSKKTGGVRCLDGSHQARKADCPEMACTGKPGCFGRTQADCNACTPRAAAVDCSKIPHTYESEGKCYCQSPWEPKVGGVCECPASTHDLWQDQCLPKCGPELERHLPSGTCQLLSALQAQWCAKEGNLELRWDDKVWTCGGGDVGFWGLFWIWIVWLWNGFWAAAVWLWGWKWLVVIIVLVAMIVRAVLKNRGKS